jgi:hypothetical protein
LSSTAIVMLENIYQHVEMGEDPLTASLVGSHEIGFTIVSMTLSLAAVFIPVRSWRRARPPVSQFSVSICVAILISGACLSRHADVVQPVPQKAVGPRGGSIRTRDRTGLRMAAARL